jgi:hypothetical protein
VLGGVNAPIWNGTGPELACQRPAGAAKSAFTVLDVDLGRQADEKPAPFVKKQVACSRALHMAPGEFTYFSGLFTTLPSAG